MSRRACPAPAQQEARVDASQFVSENYLRNLPFETDKGVAARAALGLIVLASDQTIEYEFRRMTALSGVGIYESRIYNASQVTPEALHALEKEIAQGAKLILPGLPIDVMAFGCNSGTMILGEETVYGHIRASRPDVACTSPVTGMIAAFERLNVSRIAVLTPYSDAINKMVADYLRRRDLDLRALGLEHAGQGEDVAHVVFHHQDAPAFHGRFARARRLEHALAFRRQLRLHLVDEQRHLVEQALG